MGACCVRYRNRCAHSSVVLTHLNAVLGTNPLPPTKVNVYKAGDFVVSLKAGAFFGEQALLTNSVRNATIKVRRVALRLVITVPS
jgi:hypothetical protein